MTCFYSGILLTIIGILILVFRRAAKQSYLINLRRQVLQREFMYIDPNGKARELLRDEADWLSQILHPESADKAYIKKTFNGINSKGNLSGFLRRSKLPCYETRVLEE